MTITGTWYEYGKKKSADFDTVEAAKRHLAHLWMAADGAPIGVTVDGESETWTPEQARPYHHDNDYDPSTVAVDG